MRKMTVGEYDLLLQKFKEINGLKPEDVMPFPPTPIDEIEGELRTRRNDMLEDITCTAEFSCWKENVGDDLSWTQSDYSNAAALRGEKVTELLDNPLIPSNDKLLYAYWSERNLTLRKKELSDLFNAAGFTITSVTHF